MLNYKVILIEIALVVITTSRHISVDDQLIDEAEIFDAGEDKGISNFRRAFKNLTIEKIENWIDRLPDSSGNASLRKQQKDLNIKYFQSLPNGLNEDVYYKESYVWCTDKVADLKQIRYIDPEDSDSVEVETCKKYIDEVLYTTQDLENGKLGMFKKLYEKWSGKMIYEMIEDERDIYYELYTLGYFNHVANYVMDERHIPDGFKSIKQFCTDEGYKLLTSELD